MEFLGAKLNITINNWYGGRCHYYQDDDNASLVVLLGAETPIKYKKAFYNMKVSVTKKDDNKLVIDMASPISIHYAFSNRVASPETIVEIIEQLNEVLETSDLSKEFDAFYLEGLTKRREEVQKNLEDMNSTYEENLKTMNKRLDTLTKKIDSLTPKTVSKKKSK